jgi:hypothetical protein
MKRAAWLARKGHACETIRTSALEGAPQAYYTIIHDADQRQAEGWGKSEEAAFAASHERYLAARRRAEHSRVSTRLERLRAMQSEIES